MAVGACACIAFADIAQVVMLGKGFGAIGGAALYAFCTFALVRHWAWIRWPIRAMPLIPLAVFSGLLGTAMRDQLVDAGMLAVFVLQVFAAGATLLRGEIPAAS